MEYYAVLKIGETGDGVIRKFRSDLKKYILPDVAARAIAELVQKDLTQINLAYTFAKLEKELQLQEIFLREKPVLAERDIKKTRKNLLMLVKKESSLSDRIKIIIGYINKIIG